MSDARQRVSGLWSQIDRAFAHADEKYPGAVSCKAGCGDCCGKVPTLHIERFEADIVREHIASLDEAGRARVERLVTREEIQGCKLQDEEMACGIWQGRPTACRMFGLPFRERPDISWPDGKRRLPMLIHGAMEAEARHYISCHKNFVSVKDDEIESDVLVDVDALKAMLRTAEGGRSEREVLHEVVMKALGLPVPEKG